MEALPRLRARISSLEELRELFRAMRALAASQVQEAQGALGGIRRYVEVIEDSISDAAGLLALNPDGFPVPGGADASVLIVICSEHGFTGALNERLLDRAVSVRGAQQGLVVVGSRGAAISGERGMDVDQALPMATHVGGVLNVARRIAGRLTSASTVDIAYSRYRRGGSFEIEVRRIIPLDPSLLGRLGRHDRPLHHLAPEMLLDRLAREYLFAEVTRAVMESFASENGARLRAMESADRNVGDKLEALTRQEHALRQEAITAELLDVVTGSEAVRRPAD